MSSIVSVSSRPSYASQDEAEPFKYVRKPLPIVFPIEEKMPETTHHFEARVLLYEVLKIKFSDIALIGSDQFVYWDAFDPKKKLSPDVMLRLNARHEDIDTWKVWERGAPHIAIEMISPSDASEAQWQKKLKRYRCVGIEELVYFNPYHKTRPLRVWDNIKNDLVERKNKSSLCAKSRVLNLWWVVMTDAEQGRKWLRLSYDPFAKNLLPTKDELFAFEQQAKEEALQQIDELKKLLKKK